MRTWFMTIRQPWASALAQGILTCETRSYPLRMAPGDLVYIHASKSLWPAWMRIHWGDAMFNWYAPEHPRGCVLAHAIVKAVGLTTDIMPQREKAIRQWGTPHYVGFAWSVQFGAVMSLRTSEYVYCRGTQRPTRTLPPELRSALSQDSRERREEP